MRNCDDCWSSFRLRSRGWVCCGGGGLESSGNACGNMGKRGVGTAAAIAIVCVRILHIAVKLSICACAYIDSENDRNRNIEQPAYRIFIHTNARAVGNVNSQAIPSAARKHIHAHGFYIWWTTFFVLVFVMSFVFFCFDLFLFAISWYLKI